MSSCIYITEPEAIDSKQVKQYVDSKGLTLISGNTQFTNASQDCDTLLIRSATHVTSDIKKHFPNLKNVVRVGTGLDNVDLDFCKANGVHVYNAAGANADAVAEYVVGTTLCVLRKLHLLERHDVEIWDRFKFRGRSISGKTVGIVGFGNIGKLVYAKFKGLGCTSFFAYDPYLATDAIEAHEGVRAVSLERLFRQADVISLHIPLTDQTKYTIGAQTLTLFKPDAVLINASRGGIVDETALIKHLQYNPEMIYIADTVENEPYVNQNLMGQDNIVITPHIGSLTHEAEVAMLETALENFLEDRAVRL